MRLQQLMERWSRKITCSGLLNYIGITSAMSLSSGKTKWAFKDVLVGWLAIKSHAEQWNVISILQGFCACVWMCMPLHCSVDSSITLCKLQCVAAANALHICLEGKVSGVRQRVQAPCLVWNSSCSWLPHLWDSYHCVPGQKAVPKWQITVTSALYQKPVSNYIHLTHLDTCIK